MAKSGEDHADLNALLRDLMLTPDYGGQEEGDLPDGEERRPRGEYRARRLLPDEGEQPPTLCELPETEEPSPRPPPQAPMQPQQPQQPQQHYTNPALPMAAPLQAQQQQQQQHAHEWQASPPQCQPMVQQQDMVQMLITELHSARTQCEGLRQENEALRSMLHQQQQHAEQVKYIQFISSKEAQGDRAISTPPPSSLDPAATSLLRSPLAPQQTAVAHGSLMYEDARPATSTPPMVNMGASLGSSPSFVSVSTPMMQQTFAQGGYVSLLTQISNSPTTSQQSSLPTPTPPPQQGSSASGTPNKGNVCRHWIVNRCTYGSDCRFAHPSHDIPLMVALKQQMEKAKGARPGTPEALQAAGLGTVVNGRCVSGQRGDQMMDDAYPRPHGGIPVIFQSLPAPMTA
eukprot:TRINITY_DN4891_c1_g1_i1.p2 TRINITY_DN4891_c1_g1~~TRINITY_DN4891_c1_g1_i1.p2  ORF type:complete len:401 (+),score=142.61 TRINITY_DN4891_c1_g1_i1:111-1313(+)